MKKIVIINHYGITPDLPGATKHYDMAKFFSEKESHEVEFWMCGYNHHTGTNHKNLKGFKIQSIEKKSNLNIFRIKSTPYRKSSIMRQLNIMFFDLITAIKILFSKNIDVVILSVPPVSILNVLATKIRKMKLITDVEDLWPLFLIDMGMKNKVAIKYMEMCSNYTYNSSDGIAAVSEGMMKYVQKKINQNNKTVWLSPLGVNIKEYFYKNKNEILISDKVWKKDFKVMYVGAHGRANDLYSVLKTVGEFNALNKKSNYERKVSFIFIGDGDQKTNLIRFSEEMNLQNVYFEEAIPGNLVPDYLMHADVCLTNLKKIESFKLVRPNKLFQYMALGKPIISGIWGEAKSILEEANSGMYVDFTQYNITAQKLRELFNNQSQLNEYGKNGKVYIEKYGNRDLIFEEFYNELIKVIEDN